MKKRPAVLVAILACLLALVGLVGWPAVRPGDFAGPRGELNVLLITLDTTRADRIGCYGYPAAETGALDGLAAGGVRFAHAYSNIPLTLPSHATIMTGLLPPEHGIHGNSNSKLGPDQGGPQSRGVAIGGPVTLAGLARGHGLRTGAFIGAFVLDRRFGLSQGFEVYDDRVQPAPAGIDDVFDATNRGDVVADRALAWLADHAGERFFCWVHFYDPHVPYDPPEPYRSRLKEPYDGEVAFLDSQVRRLLNFLDRRGLRTRTLVIACGDHGEAFGEHDEVTHGAMVYNTTMHVPLIVNLPGRIAPGRVINRAVSLRDVAPTVLAALGWARPAGMSGADLLADPPARGCYGESEFLLDNFGWAPLKCWTADRWKYILCPRPELYDLVADPGETTNLADRQPQTAAEMRGQLEAAVAAMHAGIAPTVALDGQALKALQQLGYLQGVAARPRTLELDKLKDPKDMIIIQVAGLKASELIGQKKYQEAIDLLAPLVARSPDSLQLHDYLARCYVSLGRPAEARRQIEAYLALNPGDRAIITTLGTLLIDQGRPGDAVRLFRQALRMERGLLEPLNGNGVSKIEVKLHVHLGIALGDLGQPDQAIEQYRLALAAEPDNLQAHNNLANICNAQGRFEEAISDYQAALKQEPANAAIHANYGVALARLGRLDEAIDQYKQSLAADPTSADVRINLADALLAAKRTDEAVDQYRRAVAARPNEDRPVLVLAKELLALGREPEAVEALAAAAAGRKSAELYHNLALVHARADRLGPAVENFRKALELDPKADAVRNNLGLTLCRQKKYGDALKVWREGLALAPGSQPLAYDLAWWLATGPAAELRNGPEAVKFAEALNEQTGRNNPAVLDALAAALAEAGRFDQAVAAARRAEELARAAKNDTLARDVGQRLQLYSAAKPYHQGP